MQEEQENCLESVKSAWRFQRQLQSHEQEMSEYWRTRVAFLRWRLRVAEQMHREDSSAQENGKGSRTKINR